MRWMISMSFAMFLIATAGMSRADDAADAALFEAKVRPLLVARCAECHGSDKPKAGLRLDSREAVLAGGESGPAVVSGKPLESLLIDVIEYRNTVQMPPKAKLPDAEIAILTDWVRRGLPWPNSKPTVPAAAPAARVDFSDEQKSFWAFQPVKNVVPPPVRNEAWVRSPVDRFILSELESRGLPVTREADLQTLVRRVTIDLTGLTPTPDEVAEFVADSAPDALERLVDRLLASPRYGERWGRHWLDVARYADSNGLDENLAYANAYRYRDYVVKSMRDDKPYDQFLLEQIAGDLLETSESVPESDRFDPLVATGFLCLGAKMLAEDDPVKMQMDIIDEQVDTIARAVMGLTLGCARCHDHKFDPISTEDYYGLAGVFKSTQTMDNFSVVARWHERPLASPEQLKHRDELQQLVASQNQAIENAKRAATAAILNEVRQNAGAYLLAATREFQLAERLKNAKPRGNEPDPAKIAGAILIEAEDYSRGNVIKDRETYGKGIGVLVNRGETPNFTEYDVELASAATYQLELRYAAAGTRPVKVFVNGQLAKPDAAANVTGSWTPESQTWFVEGFVSLTAGQNVIRLEQPQYFPHLDKLLLTPAEMRISVEEPATQVPVATTARLIPSIQQQWSRKLADTKSDPKSILTAWHQLLATGKLTVDADVANGVSRLLGESQPSSLAELSERYQRLFTESQRAWQDLKGTEAGQKATALADPVLDAARVLLTDPKGALAVPADIEANFPPEVITQLKEGREKLARRQAAVPAFPEVMAVAEAKPENLKIHLRGSHLTLGREAPRQIPRIFAGTPSRDLNSGSGRLQLAHWLIRPEHPLTARVMANRIWQWHFGQGLIRSPDNFGNLGERPSHPALLDWIASRFSRSGEANPRAWSLKALHRMLVSSATYRQATDYNAAAAQADPENRYMWRFHRQRMDVEVLRDSLLAISGQLDETPGGTLLPTANRAYVTSTANVNPAVYNSNRRSIYLPVVRSALFQVFTAFDFADPSTLVGQRDQTTVAPQALFMMNSQFVYDQSRVLADRLQKQDPNGSAARIRSLYNLAYSRDPSAAEVSRGIKYLDTLRLAMRDAGTADGEIEPKAWTSFCRAILSANEFVYVE